MNLSYNDGVVYLCSSRYAIAVRDSHLLETASAVLAAHVALSATRRLAIRASPSARRSLFSSEFAAYLSPLLRAF